MCTYKEKYPGARQQNISISPIYEVNPSIRWCCSEDIIKKIIMKINYRKKNMLNCEIVNMCRT